MSSCEASEGKLDLNGPKIFRECDASGGAPCPACVQHMKLQHKIAAAKENLDNLLKEEKNLRKKLNNNHDPISQVPREIASLIFQHCIPSFDTAKKLLDTLRNPLVLGAVCQTWRQIAWSTPQLWSYVYLGLYEKPFKGQLQILKGWLSRSGKLPLSIRVREASDTSLSSNPDLFKVLSPLLKTFNSYSNRWKDISFEAPGFLLSYLTGNHNGAHNLQRLELHSPYEEMGKADADAFTLTAGLASAPRFVHIGGYVIQNINILWTNITHITAEYITQSECLDLLRFATKLESCSIINILSSRRFSGPFISKERITHDRLQTLRVIRDDRMDSTSNCHARVLERFMLPALKTLFIDIWDVPVPVESIKSLVLRSDCALESLSFQQAVYNDEELIALLGTLPYLRKLDLSPYRDEPGFGLEYFFRLLSHTSDAQSYSDSDGDSDGGSESARSGSDLSSGSTDNESSSKDHLEATVKGPLLPNLYHFKYMVPSSKEVPWELLPAILAPVSGERPTLKTLTIIIGRHLERHYISVKIKGADSARIQRCRELFRAIGITLDVPKKVDLGLDNFSEHFRQYDD